MTEKEGGILKKLYLGLRWPVVLGLLVVAVVLFLVGMIQTLGYNGTTSLQPVLANEPVWTNFNKFFSSDQNKGAPYQWIGPSPKTNNSVVNFDKRLIRVLTYESRSSNASCVWNGTHEKIGLSVDSSEMSDLITYPGKQQSVSTLYRGTGVRLTSAGEVKCTIQPKSTSGGIAAVIAGAAGGNKCPHQVPTAFDHKPISLLSNVTVSPDTPYDQADCEVICAVDFYPGSTPPVGTSDVVAPIVSNSVLQKLNPTPTQADFFKYEDITDKTRQAGIYKTAQLMLEIMKIDDPNCEKSAGNQGGQRAIPTTMIVQGWVMSELKDNWKYFEDLAIQKFKFSFQTGSPLAGLSYDPNLDTKGLQINF